MIPLILAVFFFILANALLFLEVRLRAGGVVAVLLIFANLVIVAPFLFFIFSIL
jgi:hypothetical protein